MSVTNFTISSVSKPMGASLHLPQVATAAPYPLVIWIHGFKGFRNWGHFPAIAAWWAEKGFACLRFDFSHNGTRPESPFDLTDLEAFGRNTYSKELEDLLAVIHHAQHSLPDVDKSRIYLVGHSRGGAATLLAANRSEAVRAVATWAGVGTLLRFSAENIADWRHQGVTYVMNSRTGQQLPVYDDIFRDWEANSRNYNLKHAARALKVPYLQIHGAKDTTVTPAEASALHLFNQQAEYYEIPEADHTFGGKHPWTEDSLPQSTLQALQASFSFFQTHR